MWSLIVNDVEHPDLFERSQGEDQRESGRACGLAPVLPGKKPDVPAGRLHSRGTIFEMVAEKEAPIVDKEIRGLKVKDFVFIAIRKDSVES